MPEGDTVWNTAERLAKSLRGAVVEYSDFRVPALACASLVGWTVTASSCRGKHLLLRLTHPSQAPRTLHSHLRMDGAWRTFSRHGPGLGREASAHTARVVLATRDTVAVGFHLHDLALVPTAQEDLLVGHLGPDLLGPDWDPVEAVRRLRAHPERPIADALLDQRNLAGLGNVYQAEVLFLRGVSPWARVSDVTDLTGLVVLAQRLIAAGRGARVRSTTGSLRRGETTYVHGRRGAPCRRCGTSIAKDERSDRVRYWCPECQPGPAPPNPARNGIN